MSVSHCVRVLVRFAYLTKMWRYDAFSDELKVPTIEWLPEKHMRVKRVVRTNDNLLRVTF